ncbi:MAG TPA: hypothetical protein VGA47_12125 [Candidatus Dormibacteraeota bacterium]
MKRETRILLLCDDRRDHANTVLDHIDAFRRFSRHSVRTFNPKAMRHSFALDLDEFDVVVAHYSVVLSEPLYMSPSFMDKLRRFRGLKIEFIQDDYRWVNRATAAARDVGIKVLFTVAPEPAAGKLYDQRLPGVRRVQTLTGYVPENLVGRPLVPRKDRRLDVGYRARDLPYWLGRLSREKSTIGRLFLERAPAYGLRCDISSHEQDRIYGAGWIEFLSSSKATLGTESGASIADFEGGAERAVHAYLRSHPRAPFEEVDEAVLQPYEGNVVVNVISPRVFEAAALGTALVMFPGAYSGVVSPGRHYIQLEKDFSNMDDVVAQLRDEDLMTTLTQRAHEDLVASGRWSFATFIKEFDGVVDEEAQVKRGEFTAPRWRVARLERSIRVPGVRVRVFQAGHRLWSRIRRRDRSMAFAIEYDSQIEKGFVTLRLLLADRDLRALFRLGRRLGTPLDRLLREILELSLLRRAASGSLVREQDFALNPEFDVARKALCFVSVPTDHQTRPLQSLPAAAREAVRSGDLSIIEWDHRALGGKIQLDGPVMEVGIGNKGLENFTVLSQIGRENPSVLDRALAPVMAVMEADPVTNSVG